MFWFEVEDRVSGEGLKEVGSKMSWKGWKELYLNELKVGMIYEFSSLVSLMMISSWCLGWRHSTGHLSLLLLAWPRHDPLAAGGRRPGTGKRRGVHTGEMTWSTRAGKKGGIQDRGPEQGSPEQESRTGMSKPVTSWLKKKTRTRKSLGRGRENGWGPEQGCPNQWLPG